LTSSHLSTVSSKIDEHKLRKHVNKKSPNEIKEKKVRE